MRLPARDGPKASFVARAWRSNMLDSLLGHTVKSESRYTSIQVHHYGPLLLLITSGRRAELAARASASPGSHTVAEAGVRSRCAKRWPLIGGARWPWIQSWWKVWSSAREDARRSRPRRSRSFSWTALPALCPISSTLNGSQCSARLPAAAFWHVPRAVGARRRDREFRGARGEGGLTSRNPPRLARQHQLLPAEGVQREGLASIWGTRSAVRSAWERALHLPLRF